MGEREISVTQHVENFHYKVGSNRTDVYLHVSIWLFIFKSTPALITGSLCKVVAYVYRYKLITTVYGSGENTK